MMPLILDPVAQAHSEKVKAYIRDRILTSGGAITFETFMQLALYAPGLGYYVAGAHKFGEHGDFVTAPEISPLFSYVLARDIMQRLRRLNVRSILEFGAGTGKMAYDILQYLSKERRLPERYCILEVSPSLREQQHQLLKTLAPSVFDRVVWLDTLPPDFEGVMVANEVLDAMPVCCFERDEVGILEGFVALEGEHFVWEFKTPETPGLMEHIKHLEQLRGAPFPRGYRSEVNLKAAPWIRAVAHSLKKGAIILVDYGFPAHEYYHDDRSMGTLMCHYRHHSHGNPFVHVGLQDITAHVDFSEVMRVAEQEGFSVSDWQTQAHFLLTAGLLPVLEDPWLVSNTKLSYDALSSHVKRLTMPYEMGEFFKVLVCEL